LFNFHKSGHLLDQNVQGSQRNIRRFIGGVQSRSCPTSPAKLFPKSSP
jgi:hypothetical protein